MMHTVESVEPKIIEIVEELTEDWDVDLDGGVGPATTMIGDIGFASIDFIQLVVAIEGAYKQKLGFQDLLMQNGAYVDDLSVRQIATFVSGRLNGTAPAPAPAAAPVKAAAPAEIGRAHV